MLGSLSRLSRTASLVVLLLFTAATVGPSAQQDAPVLGTIRFPTSGSEVAQREFETGVLALHSFWYAEARDHFRKAQELDPAFGMAYWGEAMTYDDALGTETEPDSEEKGRQVVERFTELDGQGKLKLTARERDYLEAVKLRFRPEWDVITRRREYGQAMDRLSDKYPDDDEAKAFSALALMSYPAFDREQALHVVAVAAPLEEIFMRNPNHPGVLHYLIHVYDTQTFASMGLRQARIYADIAPASSHAHHMPSHIFRFLGMWDEVASSNEESYRVSVEWQQRTGRPLHMRDYHSLDWLLEAYLRLGRLDDAANIMKELDDIEREIESRGEDPGQFPSHAENMRLVYRSAAGQ